MATLKTALRAAFTASGKTLKQIDTECGFRAANYLTVESPDKLRPDPWLNVLPSQEKWEIIRRVIGCGSTLDGFFAEAEREVIGTDRSGPASIAFTRDSAGGFDVTAPATEAAKQWDGWGTSLKPSFEPVVLARKPLVGTVAANVQRYGTGALNIDASRIEGVPPSVPQPAFNSPTGRTYGMKTGEGRNGEMSKASGRWPANLIHDGSPEVVECFPETGESAGGSRGAGGQNGRYGPIRAQPEVGALGFGDSGSASRFFYCAKASKADRYSEAGNDHPTVKPLALIQYLIRLITPPGGLVLDPFLGSGTTAKAAHELGFRCIGIDLEERHCEIAAKRLTQTVLDFGGAA